MKNETNTQHTQGEWVIINSEKSITVTTRAFGAICEIPHGGKAIEEHQANAQLIARAPELLKENEQLKVSFENERSLVNDIAKERDTLLIQKLQQITLKEQAEALNAELLEALKEVNLVKGSLAKKLQVIIESAIAKAEGKTLVV